MQLLVLTFPCVVTLDPVQVEAFLRGPNQTFTLRGFSGIQQARRAADDILGRHRSYGYRYNTATTTSNSDMYNVTAVANGIGKTAYVSISKTRDWYQRRHVQSKEGYKRELQAVKALQRRAG